MSVMFFRINLFSNQNCSHGKLNFLKILNLCTNLITIKIFVESARNYLNRCVQITYIIKIENNLNNSLK